jgi:hypothetical protein
MNQLFLRKSVRPTCRREMTLTERGGAPAGGTTDQVAHDGHRRPGPPRPRRHPSANVRTRSGRYPLARPPGTGDRPLFILTAVSSLAVFAGTVLTPSFAAMVPIARVGVQPYAYASLGRCFVAGYGWDLIIEYATSGNMAWLPSGGGSGGYFPRALEPFQASRCRPGSCDPDYRSAHHRRWKRFTGPGATGRTQRLLAAAGDSSTRAPHCRAYRVIFFSPWPRLVVLLITVVSLCDRDPGVTGKGGESGQLPTLRCGV